MNNRKSDIRNVDVHGASHAKQLRSEYHLENEKKIELLIPEWFFKEPKITKDIVLIL